jgi:hypothetical protein
VLWAAQSNALQQRPCLFQAQICTHNECCTARLSVFWVTGTISETLVSVDYCS